MADKPKRILAIEAAIRGGSIALLDDGHEIDSFCGMAEVSRAEDLLANISHMLERSGTDKKTLDLIAVSNGPGSYTGIRIGLATAIGLHNALKIPYFGISSLAAMAFAHKKHGSVVVAAPIGRDEICWQIFENTDCLVRETAAAQVGNSNALGDVIEENQELAVLVHRELEEQTLDLLSSRTDGRPIEKYAASLAFAIGTTAYGSDLSSDMRPLYVQNPRYSRGFA